MDEKAIAKNRPGSFFKKFPSICKFLKENHVDPHIAEECQRRVLTYLAETVEFRGHEGDIRRRRKAIVKKLEKSWDKFDSELNHIYTLLISNKGP